MVATECRKRLSTIQQSYPGHMDKMLFELDELERLAAIGEKYEAKTRFFNYGITNPMHKIAAKELVGKALAKEEVEKILESEEGWLYVIVGDRHEGWRYADEIFEDIDLYGLEHQEDKHYLGLHRLGWLAFSTNPHIKNEVE